MAELSDEDKRHIDRSLKLTAERITRSRIVNDLRRAQQCLRDQFGAPADEDERVDLRQVPIAILDDDRKLIPCLVSMSAMLEAIDRAVAYQEAKIDELDEEWREEWANFVIRSVCSGSPFAPFAPFVPPV